MLRFQISDGGRMSSGRNTMNRKRLTVGTTIILAVLGKQKNEMRRQIQKEKKERTISERHIERIIKTDPRIVKGHGNTYHIDKVARFETRYQRPDMFGQDMLNAAMDGFRTTDSFNKGKTIQDTT